MFRRLAVIGSLAGLATGAVALAPAPAHAFPDDTVPPQVTVTVSQPDGTNGWHRAPAEVTLRASDRSGLDETSSRVWLTGAETGDVEVVTGFAEHQVTGQGATTVHWQILDHEGNATSGSRTVSRDSVPPVVDLLGGRPVVDVHEVVPLEASCGEPVSGLASCRVEGLVHRRPDGTVLLVTSVPQWVGASAVAVDNAGNEARAERVFLVEAPPRPPEPSTTALQVAGSVSSRTAPRATITLGEWGATGGDVVVKDGATVVGRYAVPATVSLAPSDWTSSVTVALPRLRPGTHRLTATFLGNDLAAPSTSRVVPVVSKSPATLAVRYVVRAGRHQAAVTVRGLDAVATGPVAVFDGRRKVGTATLRAGKAVVRLAKLGRGAHRLTVRYAGSPTVQAVSSRVTTLRVG